MHSVARILGTHSTACVVKYLLESEVKDLFVIRKSRKTAVELVDAAVREGIRIRIRFLCNTVPRDY